MKRRAFLNTTSALAATSMVSINSAFHYSQKTIRNQRNTVRKEIRKDLLGTLKKATDIGYNSIELATNESIKISFDYLNKASYVQ